MIRDRISRTVTNGAYHFLTLFLLIGLLQITATPASAAITLSPSELMNISNDADSLSDWATNKTSAYGLTPGGTTVPATFSIALSTPAMTATKVDALLLDGNSNGVVNPGDTVRYTVGIQNSGDSAGTAVVFTDTLDSNTTLVVGSVTTTQGSVTSGNGGGDSTVGISIGSVVGGGSAVTVTFDVTVNEPFPVLSGQICNQGTVAGSNFTPSTDDSATGTADDATCTSVSAPDTAVTLAGGILTISDVNGGDSADDLTISYSADNYTITDSALTIDASAVGGGFGTSVTVTDTGVTGIRFAPWVEMINWWSPAYNPI
ncbi:MAG: hypothetical protein R2932_42455 [Caldilineaceae bacterium]